MYLKKPIFDTSGRIWPSVWLQISTGRERCARTIRGRGQIQLVVRLRKRWQLLLHFFKIEIIRELLLQMVYNKQVIDSVTIIQPCPVHRRFIQLWEGWGNTGEQIAVWQPSHVLPWSQRNRNLTGLSGHTVSVVSLFFIGFCMCSGTFRESGTQRSWVNYL